MVSAGVTPAAAVRTVQAALSAAGCPDADYDARELVRGVLGADPRLREAPLTAAEAQRLTALAARRAAREPLQYLLGEWAFMGLPLRVGPGVLCPRPDSEVVCEAAIDLLRHCPAPVVLDLCAGTGCLGLGVRRFVPSARVTCVEKSPAALRYLCANTACTGVKAVEGDLFTFHRTLPAEGVDLILCNPPYLTAAEMAALMPETAHEPAMALDGGADGLDFYRALVRDYRAALRPGGWLVLEIGCAQRQAVLELGARFGWQNGRCVRDYGGNDRAVLLQKL
ncbi:MAG: peptide chain release factor N(5)-glutamine methyltransferase [Gemmiger sp.]